jgi:octaprenyl-diphosphate synthase
VALATELIHSATLLHDDVIDDGTERRGLPCSRILWGNAVSVLAGDHLLVSALQSVFSMSMPPILNDMLAMLSRMVDAEILQLRGRKQLDLRESTYRDIIAGKTASLFGFACKAGALAAGASASTASTLEFVGARLGVAFQLIDDVLDFSADRDVLGKDLAADVREGKPTLPLIFAAERDPSLLAMLLVLREGQVSLATDIATLVTQSGACDTVMKLAQNEANEAIRALSGLPMSPARTALEAVVRQSVDRVR